MTDQTTELPYIDDPSVYADDPEWAAFLRRQLGRAMWYLMERQGCSAAELTAVVRRAAVILNAEPDAPDLERNLGIRIASHFYGQEVKCRVASCRRKWTAIIEDPCYDAPKTRASGLCGACMLAETRTDDAVPEITGVVVRRKTTS